PCAGAVHAPSAPITRELKCRDTEGAARLRALRDVSAARASSRAVRLVRVALSAPTPVVASATTSPSRERARNNRGNGRNRLIFMGATYEKRIREKKARPTRTRWPSVPPPQKFYFD